MGKMKRGVISVPVVWAATLLTVVFWNHALIFRIPPQVARFAEQGRRLPLATQYTIDLVGPGIGPNLLVGGAVLATVALLVHRNTAEKQRYGRRRAVVLIAFFAPVLATIAILSLPELL